MTTRLSGLVEPTLIDRRRNLRIALCGARGIAHTYGGAEAFFVELAPRLAERGHQLIVES